MCFGSALALEPYQLNIHTVPYAIKCNNTPEEAGNNKSFVAKRRHASGAKWEVRNLRILTELYDSLLLEPGRRCHGNLMELLVMQFVSHATKVLRLKPSLKDNRIQNEEFSTYFYVYYAMPMKILLKTTNLRSIRDPNYNNKQRCFQTFRQCFNSALVHKDPGRPCQSLYDVKQKARLELCAPLEIRILWRDLTKVISILN